MTAAISTSAARRLSLKAVSSRILASANLVFSKYATKPVVNAKIYKYRYLKLPTVRASLNTQRLRLRRSRRLSRKRKHIRKRMLKLILRM